MPQPLPQLFPLPLTPFEHYMLVDDRAGYPMTFVIQQQFAGAIDRALFEAALAEVLAQHPLLTALVDRSRWSAPVWRQAPELSPPVDWGRWGAPLQCPQVEGIDLLRELGLRIWVRHNDDQTEITSQFHHACADGISAFQFLGDLLAAYGVKYGQRPPPRTRSIDAQLLRHRGELKAAPADDTEPPSFYQATRSFVTEVVKALTQNPSPLQLPLGAKGKIAFPGICSASIDAERLRRVAKAKGVTTNAVLMRDLFLTLRDWNAKVGSGRKRWLRITMPTSLRGVHDRHCPVANTLGYAFITRRERDCDDPNALLESIHRDTEAIKRWSLGAYFVKSLALVRRIPGALSLFSSGRRCFATAVLTNLGDPTRRFVARLPRIDGRVVAGNLVLHQNGGVPPLRPKTHAVFGVFAHRQQLLICIRCDPHLFTEQATTALLDSYVQRLTASCNTYAKRIPDHAVGSQSPGQKYDATH